LDPLAASGSARDMHETALVPAGPDAKQSELTIAVSNVNYVFSELLGMAQAKAKAAGKALEDEELRQWDVLSGIMENEALRKLLAMGSLSLPDCYDLCQLLFVGKQDGKGGGGGKDSKAQVTPEAPPTGRSKFENFFIIRHLGLLEMFLGDKGGGKDGKGGGDAAVKLSKDGTWREIVHTVRQKQLGHQQEQQEAIKMSAGFFGHADGFGGQHGMGMGGAGSQYGQFGGGPGQFAPGQYGATGHYGGQYGGGQYGGYGGGMMQMGGQQQYGMMGGSGMYGGGMGGMSSPQKGAY